MPNKLKVNKGLNHLIIHELLDSSKVSNQNNHYTLPRSKKVNRNQETDGKGNTLDKTTTAHAFLKW